ncbi:MAG: DnaD domain protein [Defluviitaleaceae bacterium]|nr:DnaD domain protein [Defluviitaleaceae bacterium]
MFDIKMNNANNCSGMVLSFTFIDEYMTDCLPVYPLIYIWSYRRLLDGQAVTIQEIGERFELTEGDVIKAWRHWEKEGLVAIASDKKSMEITFLPILSKAALPQKDGEAKESPAPQESRPQYTAQELACYRTDSRDVESLFSHAERALGKLLSYNDMSVIFGFYDWLRLPIDIIEYLFTYCEENEHRSLRYIEKCAIDWADNDITSIEQAQLYVQNFDRDYKKIMRHLGMSRYPTPSNKKYMNKWLREWGLSLEIVIAACDRCADRTEKPSFKYVDRILDDWHEKGVKELQDIAAADEEYHEAKKILRPLPSVGTRANVKPKQNRFVNFNQRDVDYSQYEKLERVYLDNIYNG